MTKGSGHGITASQVAHAKRLYDAGELVDVIAGGIGVSPRTAFEAIHGKRQGRPDLSAAVRQRDVRLLDARDACRRR